MLEIAGNIIPAIATTNAVIAGMIVLQAIKILQNKVQDCKDVSINPIYFILTNIWHILCILTIESHS